MAQLGAYIREQRENAQYSLRQLAQAAGVSNPYLSQIERGLRKPSAEILQQLAKALKISAETLYVQAGLLDGSPEHTVPYADEDGARRGAAPAVSGVIAAISADPALSRRQKTILREIYESFRAETAAAAAASTHGFDSEADERTGSHEGSGTGYAAGPAPKGAAADQTGSATTRSTEDRPTVAGLAPHETRGD